MSRVRKSLALVVCLAPLMLALCGCQSWNAGTGLWSWRGRGYDSDVNALTNTLRPPGDERQFTGLDAKARDIERSLGVR